MYKVLHYFTDSQDGNRAYHTGDTFPRAGMTVSDDRLKELAGNRNKQGIPLIEEVKESEKPKAETSPAEKKKPVPAKRKKG